MLLCFRVWFSRSFIERLCFGSFVVDVVADGCLYLRLIVELLLLSQHFTELFGDFRCCVVDLVLTLADFRCWFVDCLLFVGCCRLFVEFRGFVYVIFDLLVGFRWFVVGACCCFVNLLILVLTCVVALLVFFYVSLICVCGLVDLVLSVCCGVVDPFTTFWLMLGCLFVARFINCCCC